jgi:hypothetical protein
LNIEWQQDDFNFHGNNLSACALNIDIQLKITWHPAIKVLLLKSQWFPVPTTAGSHALSFAGFKS